ncbi:MAG: SIMPL domain-containing protein [Rhodospirillales bacterium]|nr:SIMPL domain-containing protein [Rhodospirillales bacterium]
MVTSETSPETARLSGGGRKSAGGLRRIPARVRGIGTVSLALGLLVAWTPARGATILHLSASATVEVMPDELDATLSAEAAAHTPVEAQGKVNRMVSQALAAARAVAAVGVSTGSYSVWRVTEPNPQWRANQALVLKATNGAALLGLVGTLQAEGLAVSSLAWSLASKTAATAHDKAEALALAALKAKAERTASLLGLHFTGFLQVWLGPRGQPPPRPTAFLAARAIPGPSAVPGESSVVATVSGEAKLEQ